MKSVGPVFLLLFTMSCDALFTANPSNCVTTPSLCTADTVCNTQTKHCDPIPPPNLFVLGQPEPGTIDNLLWGLSGPQGVLLFSDPASPSRTKLAVADSLNNRVLIWNKVPQSTAELTPPDVVLGQPGFVTTTANIGGISAKTLSRPSSIASDGNYLIVGDQSNRRVLFWQGIPNQSGVAADAVWGQKNFNAATNPTTPSSTVTASPWVASSTTPGGPLFVTDTTFHRILSFSAIPFQKPTQPVSFVVGQVNSSTQVSGTAGNALATPVGAVLVEGQTLTVADTSNNRVLSYLLPLQADGPTATTTLGSACPAKTSSASCLALPSGAAMTSCGAAAQRCLWVVDSGCSRVVRFPASATSADLVLGHADMAVRTANNGATPSASTMSLPKSISVNGSVMAVADTGNNRILIWPQLPTASAAPAPVILGQPNANINLPNTPKEISALSMSGASAVTGDANHLVVADPGFHRVLIWNQIPKQGGTPPDVVLGQQSFADWSVNGGAATATRTGLDTPISVTLEDGHLAVVDQGNNRVLIWNQLPTQSNAPADLVIGQPDFQSNLDNHTTPSTAPPTADSLSAPSWAQLQGGKLYVADTGNHRVLVFDNPYVPPPAGLPAASLVLGQEQMTTQDINHLGPSASSLSSPTAVTTDGTRLLISDTGNNRVLVYLAVPTGSYQTADLVLGQTNFTNVAQPAKVGPESLFEPRGLLLVGDSLLIADRAANRIVYYRKFPATSSQPADAVLGQTDLLGSQQNSSALPPIGWLSLPTAAFFAGGQLFLADTGNSRVVVTTLP